MPHSRSWPGVSVVVVSHNGKVLLPACLASVRRLDYPRRRIETIVVDNASTDGTAEWLKRGYPWVRVLRSEDNNFCRANNLGIRRAKTKYIGFLNNDATVEKAWLRELVRLAERHPDAAGITSKILLPDGRINSVGHLRLKEFYVRDRGFAEADHGQYDRAAEVGSISLCAALFRRKSLLDAGLLDEDFVMYYEDVELCHRLKKKGWRFWCSPRGIAHHLWGATSHKLDIEHFFANRNRLLFLAKHFPDRLPRHILDSQFYKHNHVEYLFAVVGEVLAKLSVSTPKAEAVAQALLRSLAKIFDAETMGRLRMRWEVMQGRRRPRVGIYDHALHFVGGGQKYVLRMAEALRDRFDVEYIANYPIAPDRLREWHKGGRGKLDFPIRIIPLPFYIRQKNALINPGYVTSPFNNPFEAVSRQSARYDFFINANMLDYVRPRAHTSVFVCHFPGHAKNAAWYVDHYDVIINNSGFTSRWMQARWGLRPDMLLYPPIDMNGAKSKKRNIILSVARFEKTGTKKQKEMVLAFSRLCRKQPLIAKRWKLVLCGGHLPEASCLAEVTATQLLADPTLPVEIRTNVGMDRLRRLYSSAKIFWHLCGLGETEPYRMEHFGMATAEAMQNSCVPVVFNGGGHREIVRHGRDGYLINSIKGLEKTTLQLIERPRRLRRLAQAARRRSAAFSARLFRIRVTDLFKRLESEYRNPPRPRIEQIAHGKLLHELRRDARIAVRIAPAKLAP
ncbi:MAG: glycosyltransferase [Elusimicrobia bacterium]|nr:glycosyltransferase [Elusimicrobiota bacterium]